MNEEPLFDEESCRVCGCTWNNACPGGCYWVEEDLCSQCVDYVGRDLDPNTQNS